MSLIRSIQSGIPVVPLMGFPGASLTDTTIKQNLEDEKIHFKSLDALYKKYQPDAMITMMDLSVEAESIGLSVLKPDNASYTVNEHPIQSREQLEILKYPDPKKDGRMPLWINVVRDMKVKFTCPSMAYTIGPYTLTGLLTGATNAVKNVRKNPDFLHELLNYSSHVIKSYGHALIEAGADVLIILEPTATVLSPQQFNMFSGKYVSNIIDAWKVPVVLHICGDTQLIIPEMAKTGCVGLSIDSMVDMEAAIKAIPNNVALIGNIDPVKVVAYGTRDELTGAVNQLMGAMKGWDNFILSTGCDLPPETNLDNIATMIELARKR